MKFRLFHANIKSNPLMNQARVEFDVARIRKMGRNGGFNEIKPARYKKAVDRVFGRSYNSVSESPQVVNPRLFRVTDSRVVRMHGGFAAMTPVREVSVLETISRNGLPVAFLESHYINRGMHKTLLQRNPAFRNKLHNRHWTNEALIVVELQSRSFTIFGGEDTNAHNMPCYVPEQHWIHNDGIDKMWYVPGPDVKVRVLKKEVVSDSHVFLNTDHPVLTATISITKG